MYQAHYLTTAGIEIYKRTIDREKFINHERSKNRTENIEAIIRIVYNYFDVELEQVKSKCRKREYINARQFAMFFIKREFNKVSLNKIGEIFGKHHATVLHAIRQVNNFLEFDPVTQRQVDELSKKIFELYK